MQELIEKASKEDHGTSVEFELNPKYFNNLDISFNVDLMKQYLQDIAMTNPGLEVQFVFKGKKENISSKKDSMRFFLILILFITKWTMSLRVPPLNFILKLIL